MYNFVYIFNKNYFIYSLVSIVSLLSNFKYCHDAVFHLFVDEVTPHDNTVYKKVFNFFGAKYKLYISSEWLDKLGLNKSMINPNRHVTLNHYISLFLDKIFPPNVQKAFYLETDMIVKQDISDLFSIDFGDKALGGCIAGFDPNKPNYVLGGPLLIDIKKWEEYNLSDNCLAYLSTPERDITYGSETVINNILSNYLYILPVDTCLSSDLQGLTNSFIDKQSLYDLFYKNKLKIIHYVGYKPWKVKNPTLKYQSNCLIDVCTIHYKNYYDKLNQIIILE